jgi:RNA-binding protein YlmH
MDMAIFHLHRVRETAVRLEQIGIAFIATKAKACGNSYGLVEYLRTLDVLEQFGWSPSRCVPHGGHQMSRHDDMAIFHLHRVRETAVRLEQIGIAFIATKAKAFEGKSDLIKEMRALAV